MGCKAAGGPLMTCGPLLELGNSTFRMFMPRLGSCARASDGRRGPKGREFIKAHHAPSIVLNARQCTRTPDLRGPVIM